VPSHPSPFGAPGAQSRAWLQQFWGEAIAERPAAADQAQALLLSRPPQLRRPLLHHNAWQGTLGARGFAQPASGASVARQLQALQRCEQVVAAHGGAMANLLLLGEPPPVLELANPAYAPPYFAALPQRKCRLGEATPDVLQDLLYAGPLEWPIDLPPP
jgi:capsular polysaccharide biosynthesis protein